MPPRLACPYLVLIYYGMDQAQATAGKEMHLARLTRHYYLCVIKSFQTFFIEDDYCPVLNYNHSYWKKPGYKMKRKISIAILIFLSLNVYGQHVKVKGGIKGASLWQKVNWIMQVITFLRIQK
jgi:hypothetical protein